MVASNIHTQDESSDDTSSPHPDHIPTTANDGHNNPIAMTEPVEPAQTSIEPPTHEVPFPPTTNTTTTTDVHTSFSNNTAVTPLSSASSSCSNSSDDSDASDTTCENDSIIERIAINNNPPSPVVKLVVDNQQPPEPGPKPNARNNNDDFQISHSTPVTMPPHVATSPSRPVKSMRLNNKTAQSNPSPKNVHFSEEGKTTVRMLMLCQPSSHQFLTRNIVLEPNQEIKVGRSITKNRVAENNAIFDCKVLSRNHALIWMADGKFYIRDTASSNGTYVNDHRLSLTATQSKPYEIKTGDIVQFGVDVLENSYQEKHGCIVTMLKFCTGSPDSEELKRAGEDARAGKGGQLAKSLSSAELYRLNTFIQEAVQREQILETKLLSLQKIIDLSRKNSANVWHSMIEEDRLLSRIDILENKLQYFQKNFTDDKLRKEIIKLQDDKAVYQNSAKEALRKVYQDRNEAVMKLSTIERALCSCEDECALLRNQLIKSQTNFKEVTGTLTMLEDRDAKLQLQEQVYQQRETLTDQKILDLYEQIKLKTVECMNTKTALEATTKEKDDMMERIEMYEKMSERISEPEDEDDEENGPAQPTTVLKWLGKMGDTGEAVEAMLMQRNEKTTAISQKNTENLTAKLNAIENNLALLEGIQISLQNEMSQNANKTYSIESSINSDNPMEQPPHTNDDDGNRKTTENRCQVVQDTIGQLKDMYAELRISLVHTDNVQKDRASELESQLIRCQHEVTSLHRELQSRPSAEQMSDKSKECEELRRQIIELATTTQYLQLQLEKLSLVAGPKCSDTSVQTDDVPAPASNGPTSINTIESSTACVQTELTLEHTIAAEAIAIKTNVKPISNNHFNEHNEQQQQEQSVSTDVGGGHNQHETRVLVQPIEVAEEYADDIALLVDPNVRREEELIAFKELNKKLTETNRQLLHQIEAVQQNILSSPSITNTPTVIVALLVVIVGYLLVAPYL